MLEKILDIPELLAQLVVYLRPQDLFSCVQVSHQWNELFIPSLWHTIDDKTQSWGIILKLCTDPKTTQSFTLRVDPNRVRESDKNKDQEWVKAVFRKYSRYVRVLSIHWPLLLEAFSLAMERVESNEDEGTGSDGLETLTIEMKGNTHGPRELDPNYYAPVNSSAFPSERVVHVNRSEPLFPEYIDTDDFAPPLLLPGMTKNCKERVLEYGWVLTQHYWNIVLCNRRSIKRLVLHSFPETQWATRSKDITLRMLARLERLQELAFHIGDDCRTENVWPILEALPRLKSLTHFGGQNIEFPESIPQKAFGTELRALHLWSAEVTIDEFIRLLSLLPNLSTLKLMCIGVPPTSPSGKYQDFSPPSITNPLTVRSNITSLQSRIFDYSCSYAYSHLVEVSGYTESVRQAILTHCPKIEVFRVSRNPWIVNGSHRNPQDHANQVLVDCASLREFDFIEYYIWVDEMLKKPWACLGLEWLCCRIIGVDRLNDEEEGVVDRVRMRMTDTGAGTTDMMTEEETAAMEKFHRCQRQHHGVYDQLAQLTRLKHLDLGYESRHPWMHMTGQKYKKGGVQYVTYTGGKTFDTLELSLNSGLDQLGALKDLEMFGFECLNHRIEKKELEWMARSWPKLNLMYGLDKERLRDIEHDRGRAALKTYFQELRPDVVHDSLFRESASM
ncbi:hypothetical protein EC991_002294 [Linnemannia zychae]|nr:hypothetical protein EC991_002294 [Linnemannia zychae]